MVENFLHDLKERESFYVGKKKKKLSAHKLLFFISSKVHTHTQKTNQNKNRNSREVFTGLFLY